MGQEQIYDEAFTLSLIMKIYSNYKKRKETPSIGEAGEYPMRTQSVLLHLLPLLLLLPNGLSSPAVKLTTGEIHVLFPLKTFQSLK